MSLRRTAGPLIAELKRRRRQSLGDRRRMANAIALERYIKAVGRTDGVWCEPLTREEMLKRITEHFAKAIKGMLKPSETNFPLMSYGPVGTGVFTYSVNEAEESGDKKGGTTP